MAWFYMQKGQRVGPCTIQQLRELLKRESILPDTRVWNSAFGHSWKMACEVPELAASAGFDSEHDAAGKSAARHKCRVGGLREIGLCVVVFGLMFGVLLIRQKVVVGNPFSGPFLYIFLASMLFGNFLMLRGVVRAISARTALATILAVVHTIIVSSLFVYWLTTFD